jgi:hypothetical protein
LNRTVQLDIEDFTHLAVYTSNATKEKVKMQVETHALAYDIEHEPKMKHEVPHRTPCLYPTR